MRRVLYAGACAAAIVFGSFAAIAQGDVIAQRQDAMKAIGAQMKTLAGMAKGEAAFDAGAAQDAGKTMKINFEKARDLFPEGSTSDKSTAKDDIWSDMEGFKAAMQKALAATDEVAAISDEASLKAALGAMGGTCKACHDKYRKPKDS